MTVLLSVDSGACLPRLDVIAPGSLACLSKGEPSLKSESRYAVAYAFSPNGRHIDEVIDARRP